MPFKYWLEKDYLRGIGEKLCWSSPLTRRCLEEGKVEMLYTYGKFPWEMRLQRSWKIILSWRRTNDYVQQSAHHLLTSQSYPIPPLPWLVAHTLCILNTTSLSFDLHLCTGPSTLFVAKKKLEDNKYSESARQSRLPTSYLIVSRLGHLLSSYPDGMEG